MGFWGSRTTALASGTFEYQSGAQTLSDVNERAVRAADSQGFSANTSATSVPLPPPPPIAGGYGRIAAQQRIALQQENTRLQQAGRQQLSSPPARAGYQSVPSRAPNELM